MHCAIKAKIKEKFRYLTYFKATSYSRKTKMINHSGENPGLDAAQLDHTRRSSRFIICPLLFSE